MRHIKPQALHFYRLYIFFFRNFRLPAVPEIMLVVEVEPKVVAVGRNSSSN